MSDPDTTPAISWSQIVAKGKVLPVPIAIRGSCDSMDRRSKIQYEDPALKSTLLSHVAAQIIQSTVNPDSALFSGPQSMVLKHTTVYELIDLQVGVFNSAKCLSEHSKVKEENHLIQIHFENTEFTKKAVKTGFTYKGIAFQGVPCNQGHVNGIVHIQLAILFIPNKARSLIDHLPHALRHHSKTLQIKFHYVDDFFEGHVSVILDTSAGPDKLQPLTRNLYLDKWDRYVPARFKSAPPVCYFYRQSGCLRAACPRLASETCFHCKEIGYIRRFCPYIEEEDMEVCVDESSSVAENHDGTDEKIIEEENSVADQDV
jgi:hypothetical protein